MNKIVLYLSLIMFLPILSFSQNGNALNFDGINDGVDLGSPLFSSTDPNKAYTIEAWIKTSSGDDDCIVCQYFSPGLLRFQFEIRDNQLNWWKGIGLSATETIDIRSSQTIADGEWHHVAGTRSATGEVKLYIDGVLDGEGMDNNAFMDFNVSIGGRTSTTSGYFEGNLDEIRIWSFEKTPADIQANRFGELNGDEAGLLAYYSFNQGIPGGINTEETVLFDFTPNGNDAELSNFVLTGDFSNWVGSDIPTSIDIIEENDKIQIEIFSNPSNGFVKFKLNNPSEKALKYAIYDITGMKIWEKEVPRNTKVLEKYFELQDAGVYFLTVQTQNRIFTEKFIITK